MDFGINLLISFHRVKNRNNKRTSKHQNLPKPSIDWDGYQDVSPTDSFLVEDFGVRASPEAEIKNFIRGWYALRRWRILRGVLWTLLGGWWLLNRNLKN